MIKTEFMKIYESLSTLNEDTNRRAASNFGDGAKDGLIALDSFHKAYDDELRDLGLMNLFNTENTLINKGVYGKIKEAKATNPDSGAVKALIKLWTLIYVDNTMSFDEIANLEKSLNSEYNKLVPEAATKIDPELAKIFLDYYKDRPYNYYGRKEKIEGDNLCAKIHFKAQNKKGYLKINTRSDESPFNEELEIKDPQNSNKLEDVVTLLTTIVNNTAEKINKLKAEREERERQRAEEERLHREKINLEYKNQGKIDILNSRTLNGNFSCELLFLGESGDLYFLVKNGRRGHSGISTKLDRKVVSIKDIKEITEPFKLVFAEIEEQPNKTGGGASYGTYFSGDSSEEKLLKPIIPTEYSSSGVDTSRSISKVSKGNGETLSLLDNIDSGAIESVTYWSLD